MVHHLKSKCLQIILLAAASLLLFGLANQDNSIANNFQKEIQASDPDTIPIVFLCPQSGYYTFIGEDAAWAARYAVNQINENGGINGKKVSLILKDTRSSKNFSASCLIGAAREVPVIVGPLDAPSSAQIAPRLAATQTISIGAYSYEEIRNLYGPYTISYMSDSEKGEIFSIKKWKEHNPSIQNVVIFTDSTDDSKANSLALLQKNLPNLGLTVTDVVDVSGDRDRLHYEKCAIQALNKKADGYISLLSVEDYRNILSQLRKRGVTQGERITASFSALSPELFQASPKDLDGTFIWNKFDITYTGKTWTELSKSYQADHRGALPLGPIIPEVYDAIKALCQCYEELDLNGTELDAASKQRIQEWFYHSKTIHGINDFSWKNGEKIADYHFLQFDENALVSVP